MLERQSATIIGALAYFGQRRVVDLLGLASPEAIDVLATTTPASMDREQRLKALLIDLGVEHVVIFPELFPYLAQDSALIEEEHFIVRDATALLFDRVVIYRLNTEVDARIPATAATLTLDGHRR